MKMKAGMPSHPGLNSRVFVGSVVVHNQMEIQFRRSFEIDRFEKSDEFLVAMPRHAVSDDSAIKRDEGSEQRRGAVPYVIVGHSAAPALLQRQAGLCAVKRLNLGLLVDAQHERLVRGIEIQPDNVVKFVNKLLISAQLEGFGQVRLKIVLLPNTSHRSFANPLRFGHEPRAPVSRVYRVAVQGRFYNAPNFPVGDSGDATRTGSILLEACQAQSQKALSPELHRRPRNAQRSRDFLTPNAIGGHLNNPCAFNEPRRKGSAARPSCQGLRFGGGKYDRRCCSAHEFHRIRPKLICQGIYDALH